MDAGRNKFYLGFMHAYYFLFLDFGGVRREVMSLVHQNMNSFSQHFLALLSSYLEFPFGEVSQTFQQK